MSAAVSPLKCLFGQEEPLSLYLLPKEDTQWCLSLWPAEDRHYQCYDWFQWHVCISIAKENNMDIFEISTLNVVQHICLTHIGCFGL